MHEFKIWAPRAKTMRLRMGEETFPMDGPNARGWWKLLREDADCGTDYAYLIDDDETPYPDPRSAHQPNGIHKSSRLYDHGLFQWTDQRWQGRQFSGAIVYEMHIGTFSEQGTFAGAIEHLDHLVDLGITHVELMPIVDFGGGHGWGYDGVALFAVTELYGGPDGLKQFVDACHSKGLAVIIDVVYNHFGPVGNYTNKFGPYLTEKYRTPWGNAVNFNEGGSDEVRRFFCDNAQMWFKDFHVDGLRMDAVHEFIDRAARKFMEQMSEEIQQLEATLDRQLVLIAESDLNDPRVVRPREAGGYGIDAQWSDDFHHALFTMLYDKEPDGGYYKDFGKMEDVAKALKRVFVYDGQYSGYRQHTHGRPVEGLSAHHFLGYIQNHDQVGNRARGERLEHLIGLEGAKVALGIVLMSPFIPMLFMGEEFAASTPFLYFADHDDEEMARMVSEGRKREFALFGFDEGEIPDPEDAETFHKSKLPWGEVQKGMHAEMLEWTKQLIHLRRTTAALNDPNLEHLEVKFSEDDKWLVMERKSARIFANLGSKAAVFDVQECEELRVRSSEKIMMEAGRLVLPGMTFAVVMLDTTNQVG